MSANSQEIPLNIECFMEDKDVSGRMKRETMEELAEGIFKRLEALLKKVLESSSKSKEFSDLLLKTLRCYVEIMYVYFVIFQPKLCWKSSFLHTAVYFLFI